MRKLRTERNVLLSVHPQNLERIKYGEQRIEFRKKLWDRRNTIERVFMYEAFPVSRIVGYFEVAGVLFGTPESVYQRAGLFTGCTKEEYFDYAAGSKRMYGVLIKCPEYFNRPVHLQEVGLRAPQDFFYLDDETVEKILKFSKRTPEEIAGNEMSSVDLAVLNFMNGKKSGLLITTRQSVH